jgi:putative polyketide hydroxylase
VLDLLGSGFTLLAGAQGRVWETLGTGGVPLTVHRIGDGAPWRDVAGRFPEVFGVGPTGAVLVRPDGFIGWRCPVAPADAGERLRREVGRLLGTAG